MDFPEVDQKLLEDQSDNHRVVKPTFTKSLSTSREYLRILNKNSYNHQKSKSVPSIIYSPLQTSLNKNVLETTTITTTKEPNCFSYQQHYDSTIHASNNYYNSFDNNKSVLDNCCVHLPMGFFRSKQSRTVDHNDNSTTSESTVITNIKTKLSDPICQAKVVRIRLIFFRIGEIDTLNEKYQAEAYIEARWTDTTIITSSLNLTPQQQQQLAEGKSVRIADLNSNTYWSPELFIENAIGQIGEQVKWFTIKKIDQVSTSPLTTMSMMLTLEICEHRRINGVFWEKLELNHFPADVQDLTISLTTHHYIEHIILKQDENLPSGINREAFVDQQEWNLYEHVATVGRETKEEYSFEEESLEQKKHPVFSVTCRAARRPGYYYWNGFCLIFLITVCAFCIFAIPPNLPQNRLQITCTLLLTSVTFRWVVNRSLPTISYLTTLDKYAIVSIIILVLLCVWHSVIGAVTFLTKRFDSNISPADPCVLIDRYVFIALFIIYCTIHVALVIWLFSVPYGRRREMERLDREYVAKLKNKFKIVANSVKVANQITQQIRRQSNALNTSSNSLSTSGGSTSGTVIPSRSRGPIRSPITSPKISGCQSYNQNQDSIIMPNHTIVPMKDSMQPIQENILQEQDDAYYDHHNDINDEIKNTRVRSIKQPVSLQNPHTLADRI
ncbi:unnamed protein product [Didymodactylos carnosus]|uniref:Uncharacterized protein n=1 Tax=Didymodactylos carnosus TaxID=1234261 RepID=A0A8S2GVI6_9BILA|nr:unnamed protein product [Didymodactylos carnosus]CAF3566146.1 unnamed protein product [Didymodactylos carnosus]